MPKRFRERNHGMSGHPLYRKWQDMMQRCYNPNSRVFQYYGGKGITVCEEWKQDPVKFIEWGLQNGYEEGKDIDKDIRVPNSLVYSPETCSFVLHRENMLPVVSRASGRKTCKLKLSVEDAQAIVQQKLVGVSTKSLAEEYKVCVHTVNRIYRKAFYA